MRQELKRKITERIMIGAQDGGLGLFILAMWFARGRKQWKKENDNNDIIDHRFVLSRATVEGLKVCLFVCWF